MKLQARVRWMWNTDVVEDFMKAFFLVGVEGHYFPGHLFADYGYDRETFYLYVGFGLFYVRFKVETNRKPPERSPYAFLPDGEK